MTGKDPLDCPEFGFDRRAFRDDRQDNSGRQPEGRRYGVSSGDSISGRSSVVARFSSRRMVSEEKPARSRVR